METIDIIKVFLALVKKDLDPYTTRKNVVIQNDETSVSLFTPSHIQFARYGRGPGKQPPISNILEYVKSRNIRFNGLSQEGTAWAIAKSIAKKGTSNYVPNAPNFLEETLLKRLKEFEKRMADNEAININDILNEEFDKLPKKIGK